MRLSNGIRKKCLLTKTIKTELYYNLNLGQQFQQFLETLGAFNVESDCNTLFQELIGTYNKSTTKEFYFEKCVTFQYEIRPVPSALRSNK